MESEIIGMYVMYGVYIIAFIITAIYLTKQNKQLREEVKSQGRMLEDQKTVVDTIKSFVDIFDIEKVKEYVKIKEETVELKKEKEIEKIVKETGETISKYKETSGALFDEFLKAQSITTSLLVMLPRDTRVKMIEDMPHSITKEVFVRNIEYFKQPITLGDFLVESLKVTGVEKEQVNKADDGPADIVLPEVPEGESDKE